MVVAFVNSSKTWGGGEKWHFEISCELHRQGWDTVVITNSVSELHSRISNTGQKIYKISISNLSFLNPVKLARLRNIFKTERVDSVIINLSADLKVAGIAAKLAGVKRIIYRRGSAIPIKNSILNRYLFKKIVTDIIANSEETKRTINQNNHNLFPENRIKVIYNGLDFKKYNDVSVVASSPEKQHQIVIGNLGRFVKQKGQHYLVDLAVMLKKKNIPVKIIIGGDGPLKEELIALIAKNQVKDIVQLPGFIDDINRFMSSIDIFVLTSLWEGFGYVIAEAMFFEKPVIAFNISSNPELVIPDKTGFLVETGNVNAIADKIELLYANKELMKALGQEGKRFVTEKLSIQKTLSELVDFLGS